MIYNELVSSPTYPAVQNKVLYIVTTVYIPIYMHSPYYTDMYIYCIYLESTYTLNTPLTTVLKSVQGLHYTSNNSVCDMRRAWEAAPACKYPQQKHVPAFVNSRPGHGHQYEQGAPPMHVSCLSYLSTVFIIGPSCKGKEQGGNGVGGEGWRGHNGISGFKVHGEVSQAAICSV